VIEDLSGASERLSRRRFLAGAAAVGTALAGGNLLAACGGDDSGGQASGGAALSRAEQELGERLRAILGPPDNLLKSGPGRFDTSAMFGLTGTGAGTGKAQQAGHRFGAEHVRAWTNGKLDLNTKYYDHKSGDPQASSNAVRQAGLAGNPFMIMSFSFGFGAVPPVAEQFKILCLDPGGGTGPIFAGLPYCYGTRASWPEDPQAGLTKTIKALHPDAKRFAVVSAQVSDDWNTQIRKTMEDLYQRENIELVDFVLGEVGATDYSTLVSKLRALNPDATVFMTFGVDPGYQAREVRRQGMGGIFACSERQKETVEVAGDTFKDWYFGFDSLNVEEPTNDWTTLFVEEFGKTNQGTPGIYEAGYYVNAFAHAFLMDRVIGAGDDITKGESYVKALEANPKFPHVYGGSGSTLGEMVLDLKTHSPSAIPMIAFKDNGTGSYEDITQLATYDIGGRDFKLLNT
jgi:ABC-type branched-subunit amino acid transport system substrate-binding protein